MYSERLKKAIYTSPSGKSIAFDFDALSREVEHKIGEFSFSGVDGTLHQDLGVGGEVYPLRIYIHGPDYDFTADNFFEMAKEKGAGYLEHPRWGRRRVQILSVTQEEQFTREAGQAVFTVRFQETLEREFPKTGASDHFKVASLADSAQEDLMNNFAGQVKTSGAEEKLSLEDKIKAITRTVDDTLSNVAALQSEIAGTFRAYIDSIYNNAFALVDAPAQFAGAITSAIRVVAEIPGRLSARLQGLKNLVDAVSLNGVFGSSNTERNNTLVDEVVGVAAVIAGGEVVNSGLANIATLSRGQDNKAIVALPGTDEGFKTRDEVMAAVIYLQDNANKIISLVDSRQEVFKNNVLSEMYIQTAQSYVPAWQTVGAVIRAALDLSFSLPFKRSFVTTKPRFLLDVCYLLYGNVDDVTLDYLIATNSLKGEEIIEIPSGREIVYYG